MLLQNNGRTRLILPAWIRRVHLNAGFDEVSIFGDQGSGFANEIPDFLGFGILDKA